MRPPEITRESLPHRDGPVDEKRCRADHTLASADRLPSGHAARHRFARSHDREVGIITLVLLIFFGARHGTATTSLRPGGKDV